MSDTHENAQRGMLVGDLRQALAALDWGDGLTRDQIRRRFRALPESIYLRLPAKKLYREPALVLHDAEIASSRAEGEFLGSDPDLPEDEALEDGGPPAWGPDPLFTPHATIDGTSAEDRDPKELDQ